MQVEPSREYENIGVRGAGSWKSSDESPPKMQEGEFRRDSERLAKVTWWPTDNMALTLISVNTVSPHLMASICPWNSSNMMYNETNFTIS